MMPSSVQDSLSPLPSLRIARRRHVQVVRIEQQVARYAALNSGTTASRPSLQALRISTSVLAKSNRRRLVPREEAADHVGGNAAGQVAAGEGAAGQALGVAELVAAREGERVCDVEDEGDGCAAWSAFSSSLAPLPRCSSPISSVPASLVPSSLWPRHPPLFLLLATIITTTLIVAHHQRRSWEKRDNIPTSGTHVN